MKATAAIIETVMSQLVAEGLELLQNVARSEKELAWNRLVMGRFLAKARGQLPKRGTPTHGWGALIGALDMSEMTALRYVALAEATPLTITLMDSDQIPTYEQLGLTKREGAQPDDVPPPSDSDAPSSPARVSGEEAGDDADETEVAIDRDTWCTPKWLTDAIGSFDLDPCANDRSHVQASREFRLDRGEDGLFMASKVNATDRVFVNPPYSDVLPWIESYAHTRFCFLLKFDPSTGWFDTLMSHTKLVLFPRGTRVQFEAPEGVPPDKSKANQFPHALFYADAEGATKAIRELCFQPWRIK